MVLHLLPSLVVRNFKKGGSEDGSTLQNWKYAKHRYPLSRV